MIKYKCDKCGDEEDSPGCFRSIHICISDLDQDYIPNDAILASQHWCKGCIEKFLGSTYDPIVPINKIQELFDNFIELVREELE